jgi:hypothetical protein
VGATTGDALVLLAEVNEASGGFAVHNTPDVLPLTDNVVGVPAQIVAGELTDKSLGAIRMIDCVTKENASDIIKVYVPGAKLENTPVALVKVVVPFDNEKLE